MQEVEKLEQTFKQRVLQQSNDQQGKTVSVILSTCQQGVPLSQNMHQTKVRKHTKGNQSNYFLKPCSQGWSDYSHICKQHIN